MTKRTLLDLIIKTIGVYLAVTFIRSIPPFLIQFTVDTSQFVAKPRAFLVFNVLHTVLPLFLSWVFLFRSSTLVRLIVRTDDLPATDSNAPTAAYATFSFWIVLIGLYYLLSSAGDLLNHVVKLAFEGRYYAPGHVVQFMTRDLIPSTVTFVLSLFFVFKSRTIESFIQRKTNKDAQQAIQ